MSGPAPNQPLPGTQSRSQRRDYRSSRAGRLLKHADFERVYETGQRHFARHFTLFFVGSASGAPRVGFTVGRVLGGAVQRNRIKRRLREAVRLRRTELQVSADVVVNPKKSVLAAEFQELAQEMGRAFRVISGKLQEGSVPPATPRSRSSKVAAGASHRHSGGR